MKINILEGEKEALDLIAPLWEKLNKHHLVHSKHFIDNFSQYTFQKRKTNILQNPQLESIKVYYAIDEDNNQIVGYCISTITKDKTGEIESLFVESDYRGNRVADTLMVRSLNWMEENSVKSKRLGVAAGNEGVFDFYAKYGFYPKVTVLVQIGEK